MRLLLLTAVGLTGFRNPTRPGTGRHGLTLHSSVSPPSVPTASASDAMPGPPFFNAKPPHDDEERKRQTEFRLNVGKVIDTVQADYPRLFEEAPDFSIYEAGIELTDPSGVSLRGIATYRNCFLLLRLMRYAMGSAQVKSKVCYAGYDPYKVRVRWNLAFTSGLAPQRTYFIDGVSAYTLSDKGFVRRHSLENIIVNGREVEEPFLAWINPLSRWGASPVPTLFEDGDAHEALAPPPTLTLPVAYRAEQAADRSDGDGKDEKTEKQPPRPLFRPKEAFEFCEESYDCEYPLFCCDLLLAKVCCSNGAFAPVPQNIPIPIPIPVEPDVWGF